jgi:hypothetical protein
MYLAGHVWVIAGSIQVPLCTSAKLRLAICWLVWGENVTYVDRNINRYVIMMKGGKEKLGETCGLNDVTSIQMNQLHRKCILFIFKDCCDIMCILKRLFARNEHWLCTRQLFLKRHPLLSVYVHYCSVWEQHRPWCTAIAHLAPACLDISSQRPEGVKLGERGG